MDERIRGMAAAELWRFGLSVVPSGGAMAGRLRRLHARRLPDCRVSRVWRSESGFDDLVCEAHPRAVYGSAFEVQPERLREALPPPLRHRHRPVIALTHDPAELLAARGQDGAQVSGEVSGDPSGGQDRRGER